MVYHLTTSLARPSARSHASPKTHVPGSPVKERGHRFYSARSGRWASRDSIEEQGGINLHGFVFNAPTFRVDVLGMADFTLTLTLGTSEVGECGQYKLERKFSVMANGSVTAVAGSAVLQTIHDAKKVWDCKTHTLVEDKDLHFIEPFFPPATDTWQEPSRPDTYGYTYTYGSAEFYNFDVLMTTVTDPRWVMPPDGYPVHTTPIVIVPPPYSPAPKASNSVSGTFYVQWDCCCKP